MLGQQFFVFGRNQPPNQTIKNSRKQLEANAVFSWVGVIMYITSEAQAAAIKEKFREYATWVADMIFVEVQHKSYGFCSFLVVFFPAVSSFFGVFLFLSF